MFSKHPSGLPYLFLTEMWERFGYYLMIGIFTLYMEDAEKGGLSMNMTQSADIYGTFIAMAYLTPFIGGLLADRWLGFRRSVVIGGSLMGIGYLMLAIPNNMTTFYLALAVMVVGNGFFKPNIATLLGNLYNTDKYRAHKDDGYSIFYMGINIGALICNFVAAYLRNTYGWGYAFAAAGIGMFIGVIVFSIGWRKFEFGEAQTSAPAQGQAGLMQVLSSVMLPAIAVAVGAYMIPGNVFGSDSNDAFFFALIPVISFFLWTLWKAAPEDKPRIKALLAIYAVVVLFWAIFKQNGTVLTKWANNYTDRTYPTWMEGPAKFMGMNQDITYKKALVSVTDEHFRVSRNDAGNIVKDTLYPTYFKNIPASELPAEGSVTKLISTEIFQSVNPFFVVFLTPLLIWFFSWLRKRKKEPSTPAKIGWGILVSALSTLVTIWAVYSCHNGAVKASASWLISTYAVITVGELCLSPMGLSMVSKMAPRHLAGLMMGGWQLATAFGNKLSGFLASTWDTYDNKADFFWLNFMLLSGAAAALFLMLRWLNRIFREQGLS
ncbi:MAG: peptide MFS transporter [Saprospiraceae bacterium]|nr:peptide MFS transporter [Saprospiraceae bacterium]